MQTKSETIVQVRNPRTGEFDFTFQAISKEELNQECARLRDGQKHWWDLGVEGRINILQQWKVALTQRREEIMHAVIVDTGRLNESIREFENIFKWIDRWSEVAKDIFVNDEPKKSKFIPILEMEQDLSPYPLVGVISPWNFPLSLSMMDMIPALLAGSAVIVKPSEVTPRFSEPVQKSINDVPELAAILRYVHGAGDVGSAMIDLVDLVVFTGSENTGRKVAAQAGNNLTPAYLELGGKDAAIILESADIEKTVQAILFGSICGMGHQCFSTERIYVDKMVYEKFIERLVIEAQKIDFAHPTVEVGQLGPIIYEKQAKVIKEHIRDAVEKGAINHYGGEIENINGGLWMRPTVISNVNHTMKIMKEETFGPIMPIMSFTTNEEAIELANDTLYGLTGSVFSGNNEEAYNIASQLNTGGVSINDAGILPFVITEDVGYTAFKCSGVGASRYGKSGVERFLHKKLVLTKQNDILSPWWYEV